MREEKKARCKARNEQRAQGENEKTSMQKVMLVKVEGIWRFGWFGESAGGEGFRSQHLTFTIINWSFFTTTDDWT